VGLWFKKSIPLVAVGDGKGGGIGGEVGEVAGGRLNVEIIEAGCLDEIGSSSSSIPPGRRYWTLSGGESMSESLSTALSFLAGVPLKASSLLLAA